MTLQRYALMVSADYVPYMEKNDIGAFVYHSEAQAEIAKLQAPIPMMLFCPNCGEQHIDKPDEPDAYCYTLENGDCISTDPRCMHQPHPAPRWENPPHRSHLCHHCKHVWRPADVCTTGVFRITTVGENDSPLLPREKKA